jgi:hypothetical protein
MTQTATQAPIIVEPKVYELPTAEQHVATITKVEDLGMVTSDLYDPAHMVRFTYVIEDQLDSKGEKIFVSERMTTSLGQKARLGKRLRSLGIDTKQPLDITQVLGMRVNAGIIHNVKGDRIYANVDYTSRIRVPAVAPPAVKTATEVI